MLPAVIIVVASLAAVAGIMALLVIVIVIVRRVMYVAVYILFCASIRRRNTGVGSVISK